VASGENPAGPEKTENEEPADKADDENIEQ
jgi:hypothetical protein